MKRFFTSLALLLIHFLASSQCKVLINEIMFSPSSMDANSMHNTNANGSEAVAEWVELYNPSACETVDISCWILGSDESNSTDSNYGLFVFPQGTTIPPHGFIVVGGTAAPTKDFDTQKSRYFCGNSRWFLSNNDGWVGLFTNKGEAVNVVYWSASGSTALNSKGEFQNSMTTRASTYACICNGTIFNSTPAKNIKGIEFAGTSSGDLGEGWKRITDGSSIWVTETPNQSTPKSCNGACIEPLRAVATGQDPATCNDKGAAGVKASGGTPPYTYEWNNGEKTTDISNLPPGSYTCKVTDACNCTVSATVAINPLSISFTIAETVMNAPCNGAKGAASVNVTPAGNYTYKWNTVPVSTTAEIKDQLPGDYTVEVTDKGCTASKTITIEQPDKLEIDFTTTDATCKAADGSATAIVKGGTIPYSYKWNNGQTTQTVQNLLSGTYTVTITDANNCTETAAVAIKNNASIDADVSTVPSLCTSATGSASVKLTKGQGPFTYVWNTTPAQTTETAGNLTPGKYTCEINDSKGCKIIIDTEVKSIIKELTAGSDVQEAICSANNGSAEITPTSGDAPYTFLWSNNKTTAIITNLQAGNYSVTFSDINGCTGKKELTVPKRIDSIKITATVINETCTKKNGKINCVISGGTPSYQYEWNGIKTATLNLSALSAGNYALIVRDTFGCIGASTSIVENKFSIDVNNKMVPDHCEQGIGQLVLLPKTGQAPYTYLWDNGETTDSIGNLKSGVYKATVTDALGCSNTQVYSVTNIKDVFDGTILGSHKLQQDEEITISARLPANWKQQYWIDEKRDTVKTPTIKVMVPFPQYGDFMVTLAVISDYGCTDIINYPIYVEPSWTFYVPNCITLNDDYYNDAFFPKYTGISEMQGWIFNRWGERIYTFDGMTDFWNGTYKGDKVKQDVYVYRFSFKDLKGEKHERVGSLTVLRSPKPLN